MCGIIGYTGISDAAPILLSGLFALEYRGYDSAGVALYKNDGILTVKTRGRVGELQKKLQRINTSEALCGIGHTRWATHGEPSDINAHPHVTDSLALVHNGIIENCAELEAKMKALGYCFLSETDTEAAAFLIDHYYKKLRDPIDAIFAAMQEIRGSFAFGIMFFDQKDKIFAVRRASPLIVAKTESEGFIASDITPILPHTKSYFCPDEDVVAVVGKGKAEFFDRAKNRVFLLEETAKFDASKAQKSGFEHFMKKEIFEEPEAVKKTVSACLMDGLPSFPVENIAEFERIHIVACGTAMHAGLIGQVFFERLARIPVSVEIASEFRYRDPILGKNDLVILLSQSGETADTLAAERYAKERGVKTLAIVNVVGSSVAREADHVIYTPAGPEIAVASTKAYSVQCAVLLLLSISAAQKRGRIDEDHARELCKSLVEGVPLDIEYALRLDEAVRRAAERFTDQNDIFYIGRGIDHALLVEGSLKLKEISYIHSEAYAAGELKHGTISLITDKTPVIALITERALADKMISAIREVRARGARVLCFISENIEKELAVPADEIISFCVRDESTSAFAAVTVLQLFAYHAACLRGLDVDKPRNLAKSVTVE